VWERGPMILNVQPFGSSHRKIAKKERPLKINVIGIEILESILSINLLNIPTKTIVTRQPTVP
jgi:hypothetical protein